MESKSTISKPVVNSEPSEDDGGSISSSDAPTVEVRFNKTLVFTADREMLVKESAYFQSMLKPCFSDHKSEYLEVNLAVNNNDVFNKVMGYISTGAVELNYDCLFDILAVAGYLQIESLQKHCLDYFTYNLNVANVDDQLDQLKSYPFVDEKYQKRAVTLKKRGLPSYSGLYFFDSKICKSTYLSRSTTTHLKMYCEETNYVQVVSCLDQAIDDAFGKDRNVNDLSVERLYNTLVIYVLNNEENCFLQYNLISGEVSRAIPVSKVQTVFCTSDKNLFVIRHDKNELNKTSFLLSVYEVDNKENINLSEEKKFQISREERPQESGKICLEFVHYYNEILYLFYCVRYKNDQFYKIENLYCNNVCAKTLFVVKNTTLDLTKSRRQISGVRYVKKLFCMKEKIYIHLDYLDEKNKKCWTHNLIFDCKTNNSYFADDINPILQSRTSESCDYMSWLYYCSMHKGVLYVICPKHIYDDNHRITIGDWYKSKGDWYKVWTEVRSFRHEDGKFVDAGIKWKSFVERQKEYYFSSIYSAVFV